MRILGFEAEGFTLANYVRRLHFAAHSLAGQIRAELIDPPAHGSAMALRQMNAQPRLHRQHERPLGTVMRHLVLGSARLESEGFVEKLGRHDRPPGRQIRQVRPSIWPKTIEAAKAWQSAAGAWTDVLGGKQPDGGAA